MGFETKIKLTIELVTRGKQLNVVLNKYFKKRGAVKSMSVTSEILGFTKTPSKESENVRDLNVLKRIVATIFGPIAKKSIRGWGPQTHNSISSKNPWPTIRYNSSKIIVMQNGSVLYILFPKEFGKHVNPLIKKLHLNVEKLSYISAKRRMVVFQMADPNFPNNAKDFIITLKTNIQHSLCKI